MAEKGSAENRNFFGFYRTMEAYGKAFDSDTSMVLSPNSDFMRFFGAASGVKK